MQVSSRLPWQTKMSAPRGVLIAVLSLTTLCGCNRGAKGKFEQLPTLRILERLHQRNEHLISSHHPLRETLMAQTGQDEAQRRAFLRDMHDRALRVLIHMWEPA